MGFTVVSHEQVINVWKKLLKEEQHATCQKVADYLASKGIYNPNTGEPLTRQAILYQMKKTDEGQALLDNVTSHPLSSKRFEIETTKKRCVFCVINEAVTQHHVVFKSQGGTDEEKNMLDICNKCHVKAHSMPKEELDRWVSQVIQRAKRLKLL